MAACCTCSRAGPGSGWHTCTVWSTVARQWNQYLLFRQRLRDDVAARASYEEAKLALLAKLGTHDSRAAYTEGKGMVVRSILDRSHGTPSHNTSG